MSGEEGPLLEGPDISGRGRLAVCSGPLDTGANPDLPLTPWLVSVSNYDWVFGRLEGGIFFVFMGGGGP